MTFDPKALQDQASPREGFTRIYEDGNPPWELGRPQAPFVEAAARIESPLLDAGCGTGNTSLFFAARGIRVTGIDFAEPAIRAAEAKAAARGLDAEFLVKDAMTLAEWDRRFASAIDSGLFHIYHGDDRDRYVRGLAHVLRPGGRLFLFGFTDEAREGGLSRPGLLDAFADGWQVESIERRIGEVNPAFTAEHPDAYPEGGPPMWFAVFRREG